MPRRPNPDPRIKKTASATETGACGHEYTRRFSLGRLAGLPATDEFKAEVERLRVMNRADMKENPCDTCFAVQTTNEAKVFETQLMKVLGLPPLPEITGTPAMIGYALKLRRDRIDTLIGTASFQLVSWRTGLAHRLIIDAINSRYPNAAPVDGEPVICPAWEELTERVNSSALNLLTVPYTHSRHPIASARGMSTWLLLRHALRTDPMLRSETQARSWIVSKKLFRSVDNTSGLFNFTDLLAATITANNTSWPTLADAANAFDVLIAPTSDLAETTLTQRAGVPFADVVEDIAVMQALTGNTYNHDDYPF